MFRLFVLLVVVSATASGRLPTVDELGGYRAQLESLERVRLEIEAAFQEPPEVYIPLVGRILPKLSRGNIYQVEEKWEIYGEAQAKLLSTPGHAEYYGNLITQYEESDHLQTPTPGWRPQYAFEVLQQLPSPETARVLAELFDQQKDWGPGIQPIAEQATKTLQGMLEDPPDIYVGNFPKWLEWREEVRQGKATFRFKGSNTRYTFDGPVGTVTPNDRTRPVRGGSGGHASAGKQDDQGADSVGKDSPVAMGTLVALAVLVMALLAYLVLRVRKNSKARR